MVPTLVVGEALLTPYAMMKALANDQEGRIDPRRKHLAGYLIKDWKEQVEEQKEPWPGINEFLSKRLRDLKEMLAAGVRIMPGTDTAVLLIWPGSSLHEELRLFVTQLGMSAFQAIVSATLSPAEFFGIQDSLGTIEPGKLADLVLLDADPLVDINNTRKIAAVVRNGAFLSSADIARLLESVAAKAKVANNR